MISVYKGVWQDKFYLVASDMGVVSLHKKLGIPYYKNKKRNHVSGLSVERVSDKEVQLAVSHLNRVLTKPTFGASAWKCESEL